jgi:hypothetical protein
VKTFAKWLSILSSGVGVSVVAACLAIGGEMMTEGLGMSLGLFGFPTTFVAYRLLDMWSVSSGAALSNTFEAMVVTTAFILQWQAVAVGLWLISRRRRANVVLGASNAK